MRFFSKPEAYLYCLHVLDGIQSKREAPSQGINHSIKSIQTALYRHEQNPLAIVTFLNEVLVREEKQLTAGEKALLGEVCEGIQQSDFQQTLQEKWENPLGRRLESQLQIGVSLHPGDVMMAAVKKKSNLIVEILNVADKDSRTILSFLTELKEFAHEIGFGSFQEHEFNWKGLPKLKQIKQILSDNKGEDFIRIMCIHFKFDRVVSRNVGGKYAKAASKVREIGDERMYRSPLYEKRGRYGRLQRFYTKRMGILTQRTDPLFNQTLPEHSTTWVADSKAQAADFDTPFTLGLIENDTPYVAGVSGMTSVMIAGYLSYLPDATLEEKQCYIAAIAAYIVSGGFHSLHEVLAPIAYCLEEENLLPDYEVVQSLVGVKTPAPRYDVYYALLEKIDPSLTPVLEGAWENMLEFMKSEYLPTRADLPRYDYFCAAYERSKSAPQDVSDESKELAVSLETAEDDEDEVYYDALTGTENEAQESDDAHPSVAASGYAIENQGVGDSTLKNPFPTKSLVLAAIQAFQSRMTLRRDIGRSDRVPEFIKIESLRRILMDSKHQLIIDCVVGAIFKSDVPSLLQSEMATKLGYVNHIEGACKFIDKEIKSDIERLEKEEGGRSFDSIGILLVTARAMNEIGEMDDSQHPYQHKMSRGIYESPLKALEKMVSPKSGPAIKKISKV